MVHSDNPAGRLYELLTAALELSPDRRLKSIWTEVLKAEDEAVLLHRLGQVFTLPNEIRSIAQAMPEENSDLLLRPLGAVESGLQLGVNAKGQQLRQKIDDTTLLGLEWASDRLSKSRGEPVVPEEELQQLHVAVHELFDEVAAASVDAELREFLLRHVQAMEAALEEVRIRGVAAIRDVVEATCGGIALRVMGQKEEASAEGERLRTKLWHLATRAAVLLSLVDGALQLGGVYDALPLPELTADTTVDGGS